MLILKRVLQILAGVLAILQGREKLDKGERIVYVWTGYPPSYEQTLDRSVVSGEERLPLGHKDFYPSDISLKGEMKKSSAIV